jgi:hypothetical protein
MLYATVAGCLAMTKTTTESRLSELLSKIRWIPGMVENVVTRRVLESWLEVGFEEGAFSVFILYRLLDCRGVCLLRIFDSPHANYLRIGRSTVFCI